ncbi:Serine protease hepsin [Folsomia candida]|uniref:Serine protease hepsin n=1 Tax=Folsomia candida TaxID=158441 RepID=A0A226DLJ1_FOLCA|nr:Serine protease hepsin [Folsomia candida]
MGNIPLLTWRQKERRARRINYCVNLLNYAGTYYPQSQVFPGPQQEIPPSSPNYYPNQYPGYPTSGYPPWYPDQDRIVGGQPTTIEKYPYQAQLLYYGSFICGGFILSATRVGTAA